MAMLTAYSRIYWTRRSASATFPPSHNHLYITRRYPDRRRAASGRQLAPCLLLPVQGLAGTTSRGLSQRAGPAAWFRASLANDKHGNMVEKVRLHMARRDHARSSPLNVQIPPRQFLPPRLGSPITTASCSPSNQQVSIAANQPAPPSFHRNRSNSCN